MAELDRRKVDGDLQRLGHDAASRQASRSIHSPISTMMPFCSASGMNAPGEHEAVLRMLPADQRLEAEDLAVDLRLRLVVEDELAARDRRAQIVLQRVALPELPVHLGLEEADHVPPVGLGAIERGVGIGEQRDRRRRRPSG